ncbi:hypothetical protein K1F50_14725 [Muricauda oceani]|uniref:Uncharacterized protein n=1 Tax=Flagellimonas oceani TaxID=2698672 RepID=A0A6G7J2D6_9FLAO|nr:hypothetical protein [Allomuricauda oceani]MBW8244060.1 hypothetical protein [Allomuricauda oceani]QII45033.1 hypothetical protein GVT53_10190 [Allomuricauda oceani]
MNPRTKHDVLVKFFEKNSFEIQEGTNELLVNGSEEVLKGLLANFEDHDFDSLFANTGISDTFRLVDGNTISNISIFDSKDRFSKSLKALDQKKDYLIFDTKTKRHLSWIESKAYKSKNWDNDDFFFTNTFGFKTFLDKWIEIGTNSNTSEDDFTFIDYYNLETGIFLLTTFTQKIQFKIPSNFSNDDIDLSERVNLFDGCFSADSKYQFPRFFKKNLIDYVSGTPLDKRLEYAFKNLDKIYANAHLDFQVYLHGISIENLREEYEDFKSDSLMPFAEITSKLTIKILSIPIAFSAILFGLSKTTNSVFQIGLVFSILVSSIILNFSLKNHFLDLESIYRLFGRKVKKIGDHKFFCDNDTEKEEIRVIVKHIQEKLNYAKRYIWSYFTISSILFLFICTYLLWPLIKTINFSYQLDLRTITPENWAIIFQLTIFFVITSFQANGFIKNNKKLKRIRSEFNLENF